MCAFHLEISSFLSKSFLFLFLLLDEKYVKSIINFSAVNLLVGQRFEHGNYDCKVSSKRDPNKTKDILTWSNSSFTMFNACMESNEFWGSSSGSCWHFYLQILIYRMFKKEKKKSCLDWDFKLGSFAFSRKMIYCLKLTSKL